MYLIRICVVALGMATVPHFASAAVVISEVAWMGSSESANHEWIELHNTGGQSVLLDGWRLIAKDGQPNITLSGSIAPGGFFLLERTSDETVPSVAADIIYTGALGNGGEVLMLVDALGNLIDQLDSGVDWALGGNNQTKDTLQRVGSTWATAIPTPRASNTERATESSASAGNRGSRGSSVVFGAPSNNRHLVRDADPLFLVVLEAATTRAYVGIPQTFSAAGFSGSREITADDIFSWNMGDGTVYNGRRVTHTFRYPGVYVVTVSGVTELFRAPKRAYDSVTIDVVEHPIVLEDVTKDYIAVRNDSNAPITISGFSVVAGPHVVTLPEHTYIPANQTVRFLRSALGLSRDTLSVFLMSPEGVVLARAKSVEASSLQRASSASVPRQTKDVAASLTRLTTPKEGERAALPIGVLDIPPTPNTSTETLLVASVSRGAPPIVNGWTLGLVAMLIIAVAAILLSRRDFGTTASAPSQISTEDSKERPLSAEDFTIIEETDTVASEKHSTRNTHRSS